MPSGSPEAKAKLVSWIVAGVLLYLLPVILHGIFHINTSGGDLLAWLPQDTEDREVYDRFAKRFGAYDNIVVSWDGADPRDPAFEKIAKEIVIRDRMRAFQKGEEHLIGNVVYFDALLQVLEPDDGDRQAMEARLSKDLEGFFTSRDGTTGSLLVEGTYHAASHRAETLELVQTVVREVLPAEITPRYDGACFMTICGNDEIEELFHWIFPLSAIVSFFVAVYFFRSFVLALTAFFISAVSAGLSIAMIHFNGDGMGDMVALVPGLTQLLAMSNIVHLINYYKEACEEKGSRTGAWRTAMANGWLPTVAATLSTIIGMGALLSSNIGAVHQFAGYAIVALAVSMVVVLTLTPAALILINPKPRPAPTVQGKLVNRFFALASDRPWFWSIAIVGVATAAGIGLVRLQSDVTIATLFSDKAEYSIHHQWYKDKFETVVGSEIELAFSDDVAWDRQFEVMRQIGEDIANLEQANTVFSPLLFHSNLAGFSEKEQASKLKDAGMLVEENGTNFWRMMIRHDMTPDNVDTFRDGILAAIEKHKTPESDIHLTGFLQLFATSQTLLISQLLRTFLLAFFIITPLIMIFLRSIKVGLVAIVGNVFPLIVFFGILGWLDFRVDVATMMIAAIAFGIAVDDTVHFLTWLIRGLRTKGSLKDSVYFAFERSGGAIIQTTLIISLGLSAYLLSDFKPSARYGIFSAVVLLLAVVGDLLLLPALILGPFKKFFSARRNSTTLPD